MSTPRRERWRCSFCQAEIHDDCDLTIAASGARGRREPSGRYCSTRCRNCVLALAALHPSPLAPASFIEGRTLITDRLLDVWRLGKGPDPALVLQAAQRVGRGLTFAAPVPSTSV